MTVSHETVLLSTVGITHCPLCSGLVELLLNQNVNVDTVTESLDTPLHAAVFGNKPEIMDSFIQAGK